MHINDQNSITQQRVKSGRWQGIDILKTICAFLVVIIHAPFPGEIGMYITTLSRISVPIFFMITGFFYSDVVQRNKEKHQIKKIFLLFVVTNAISLFAGCCKALAAGSLPSFLSSLLQVRTLTNFVIWNEPPFGRHLWYLGAILYTLIIVYYARRTNTIRWLMLLTPGILILGLIFGKYCVVLLGRQIPYVYVRNFFFLGLPYFLIGNLFFEYREQIFEHFTNQLFIAGLLIFSITTVVERYILVTNGVNASNDYYISTTFLACTVFLKFAKPRLKKPTKFVNVLGEVGKRYSTWIYVIHPLLIGMVDLIIGEKLKIIRPFSVFSFTLIICVLVTKVFTMVSHSNRQK